VDLQAQTIRTDSLSKKADTIQLSKVKDTLAIQPKSKMHKPISKEAVKDPVKYAAKDSMIYDISAKKLFLYSDAAMEYQDTKLTAANINFDMAFNTCFAIGNKSDTVGKEVGKPEFTQGSEKFKSESLTYNFKSKKGLIQDVFTEQEGGYLHGRITKRQADGTVDLKDGKYTTCSLEHPHFYLDLTKAKVIPNDKIISGPAYFVLEDVPLPIGIPFGFFPNKRGASAGVIIPTYGEEVNRGFYLRNGGFYMPFNDYFDMQINGDIYTKGSWGLSDAFRYTKRYKYSGNFRVTFNRNVFGDIGDRTYSKSRDYSINWSHNQDAKSSPNSTFSANVNMSSSSYDRNQTYNPENLTRNVKTSSISYSKVWAGTPFSLSGSANHNQNSLTKEVNLSLPNLSFNMSRIYPFRKADKTSDFKWYDQIQLGYSSNLENRIYTNDSDMFTNKMFKKMDNGFKHSIPISASYKLFKDFTVNPSLNYNGVLYRNYIQKSWDTTLVDPYTKKKGVMSSDTINGYKYANSYSPSFGASYSPKLYLMFQSRNPHSKFVALRNVISPSAGFSFMPDMKRLVPNYYRQIYNPVTNRMNSYSMFENGIYGTPTTQGKSGAVTLALRNNLEMKLKNEGDTANPFKKIKILENFDFSSSYNVYADSMNWSPINMNGGTKLFDAVNLRFGGILDPYALDSTGGHRNSPYRIKTFEYKKSGKIGRITSSFLNLEFTLDSKMFDKKKGKTSSESTSEPDKKNSNDDKNAPAVQKGDYKYFDVPWNLNVAYSLNYSKPAYKGEFIQTLNFGGGLKLTKKWDLSFRSGYDIELKKMSLTSININRDLHCWRMTFSCVPFGPYRYYEFQINAISTILQDLKYKKRQPYQDAGYYQ
jgi:hypothetical protein